MRALAALVLALVPVLAGCVGPAAEETAPAALPAAPARAQAFLADGSPAPLPDLLAEASYFLTGHRGAEPNLGVASDGAIFATAGDEVIRSLDGGRSWETVWVFGLEAHGAPVDPLRNSDPMLWVDPATDRVFADPMWPALACTWLAWSDDGGASWFERPAVCHPPPMDHQKLASGPPPAKAPPLAGALYPSVLYQCYNAVAATNCAVSYDGGLDWVVHQVAADDARHACAGINGHPAVSPDGVVVVPIRSSGCGRVLLATSDDTGLTWTVREGPEGPGLSGKDPDLAFTPDGTLYLVWTGDDHVAYLARSRDLAATWDGPFRATPPDVQSTVFAVVAAGDDGRVGVAFLGTRDTDAGPNDAPEDARWHLFVVATEDAHAPVPTFVSWQATPDEDPVQVGRLCMDGTTCGLTSNDGSRNLLDFIDAAVAPDGTFLVAYAEGCTEGCAGEPDAKPEDSRDRQVALARLDGFPLTASSEPLKEPTPKAK